jgi:5'-deoxynucleotidase YfbR-like HD superfamily hydrolase
LGSSKEKYTACEGLYRRKKKIIKKIIKKKIKICGRLRLMRLYRKRMKVGFCINK